MIKSIGLFLTGIFIMLMSCQNSNQPIHDNDVPELTLDSEDLSDDSAKEEVQTDIEPLLIMSADDIKSQLKFLSIYRYDDYPDANIDSLSFSLSEKITALLDTMNLSKKSADSIGLKMLIDEPNLRNIKLYTFDYHSGGTRGYISHPIIQWVSDGGELLSYNFSNQINCYFDQIYPLSSDFGEYYLLLGQESGSGACMQNMAYCIEIKDSLLISDNIFFVNRPYLNLCNVPFEYDEQKKLLIGRKEYDIEVDIASDVNYQNNYSDSKSDNEDLIDMLDGIYSDNKTILLEFNGREFVKKDD